MARVERFGEAYHVDGGGCGLVVDVDAEGGWEGERSEGAFHVAKERSCRLTHGSSHA